MWRQFADEALSLRGPEHETQSEEVTIYMQRQSRHKKRWPLTRSDSPDTRRGDHLHAATMPMQEEVAIYTQT